MIDLNRMFAIFSLPRDGVIHVGGYLGYEIGEYEALGFKSILFIEGHPATYERLKQNMSGKSVLTDCSVISDRIGQTIFHETNNEEAGSILDLKKVTQLHTNVFQTGEITVDTTTIDVLIEEKYKENVFSFLNIDIQGAELLAFKGANILLDRVSAINCEVNFDELYKGVPHISVLDAYLSAFEFTRVETYSATRSWGDAFYVKDRFTKV